MSDRDDGTREQLQQRPAPERETSGRAVETPAPTPVSLPADAHAGGMRSTLEGMDAVSRARMVTDMQRRAGNVAVQKALGHQSAAPVPPGLVQQHGGGGRGAQAARPPGARAKPDRSSSRSGTGSAGAQAAGDERESVNAILSGLVEHETTGASAAGRGRPSPVAGGGGSGAPLAPPRPPGDGGPRFRPGGLGGGDDPEDRTPLSDEDLGVLLEALWTLGVFRGDADRLAAVLPRVEGLGRGGELRAFALLAALNERVATAALELPPEDGPAAVAALWAVADAWRAALVDGRDGATPDLADQVAAAALEDPARAGALRGWDALARAESAGLAGDAAGAGALLAATAGDPEVPPGCVVAASVRAGVLDAFVHPSGAIDHLERAATAAEGCDRPADAGHALLRRAIVELLEGHRGAGREALHRVRRDTIAPNEAQVAAALDGVVAGAPVPEVIRSVADDAAVYGDYLVAVGLVVAAARALRRSGGEDAVDAVALLFGGISVTTRAFGPGTAGPLEFERDVIAAGLGPDGFKAVMRAAIERMERGLRQRTGPSAPPL